MAQPIFIAVNQTASPITLRQLAVTVPASGQVTVSDYNTLSEIQADAQLYAEVSAGNIRINDGTTLFTLAESLQYLTGVAASAPVGGLTSAAPANVTKATAAVGTATTAARADHKHDVSTAAAAANPPGTASAEGTSTALARADHTHALAAFGTGAGTFCQGNDARLTGPTATVAEASGATTTTSATDVLMSGMTLTPAAGTYVVWFSGDLAHSVAATINTSLYVGGVLVAASERAWQRGAQTVQSSFACACKVTVNGSQAIEGRWRTSGATATNNRRQLVIMRVQ